LIIFGLEIDTFGHPIHIFGLERRETERESMKNLLIIYTILID